MRVLVVCFVVFGVFVQPRMKGLTNTGRFTGLSVRLAKSTWAWKTHLGCPKWTPALNTKDLKT